MTIVWSSDTVIHNYEDRYSKRIFDKQMNFLDANELLLLRTLRINIIAITTYVAVLLIASLINRLNV